MKALHIILEDLKAVLKPSRYDHTLRVMVYGEMLAIHHGVSVDKFKYAAALHDYCKHDSDEDILKALPEDLCNPVLKAHGNLGHGFKAAIVARKKYGLEDGEILQAIADHTFGHEEISDLGKVLYLADHLEPQRDYVGVEALRHLALENLNEAVVLTASHTLMYELSQGHMLHENTLKMRNALLVQGSI